MTPPRRMVPVVAVVDESVAHRLAALVAARQVACEGPEAVAVMESLLAEHGWTVEMLVAGSLIRQAIEGVPE